MKDGERYKLLYEETMKHLSRLRNAFEKLSKVGMPLNREKVLSILEDDELTAYLDQIAYRFSKIQDNLGKLLRFYLLAKGENVDNLTMIDVLNLAERYELGIDKEKWFELRELRNLIVHEYESMAQKIADTLNKIHSELDYLVMLMKRIEEI